MSYTSSYPLNDRVAVITGGASGIGLEAAKALKENGAIVIISDINKSRGQQVAGEFGIDFFAADVTNSAEVRDLAKYTLDRHGQIDIAFNNAGIAYSVPSEECTDEEWLRIINIDLNSVFYCCRE